MQPKFEQSQISNSANDGSILNSSLSGVSMIPVSYRRIDLGCDLQQTSQYTVQQHDQIEEVSFRIVNSRILRMLKLQQHRPFGSQFRKACFLLPHLRIIWYFKRQLYLIQDRRIKIDFRLRSVNGNYQTIPCGFIPATQLMPLFPPASHRVNCYMSAGSELACCPGPSI